MTTKDIMNLVPTMHSMALVGENMKVVNKKKKSSKDLIGLGMKNLVGATLIKSEADLIGLL